MQVKDLQLKRALRTSLFLLLLGAGMKSFAERVEPGVARAVATTFLNNNGVRSNLLTDMSESAGFSNLYIFSGEQGFVVMAADDRVKPILGYSLTDQFVVENMPENLRWWLQGYNDEIQYAVDNQIRVSSEVASEWEGLKNGESNRTVMTTIVAPLIQSTWGQGWQYNAMCPIDSLASEEYYHYHCPTGCVATAMAQIMRYWGHPTQGEESYSYTHSEYGQQFANFGATIYNWANMPLNSANSEIAKLMYHCGVSIETDYGVSNSFANTSDAAYALQAYFGYSTSDFLFRANYQEQWIERVKTELNENRPLLYYGGGHAFVCDGYSSGNYFHFNWGWDGECNNDYYSLEDLSPHEGTIYYGDFTNNQGAIFGIQPSENTCDAPTNLTASVNGSDITLTWTAAEGVDSYRIYRNGVMIESDATGSSYIDSSLEIGVYQYYLRSNCTGGGISDNSNIVSIMVEFQGSMTIAVGDLRYSLNFQTMTAQVNGGHPTGNLVIPSSVTYSNTNTTFRVVSIRNEAFKNEVEITALTIPNSVILIGSSAFYGCSGLEQITVASSNTYYDSRENCNAVIISSTNELIIGCKNTNIPNSVTSIGSYAFYNCSGLTGSLTIPNSVTSIRSYAFYNCSGLTGALTIPNSVTSIGNGAFYNCSGLTALTIPNSVTSIGSYAFRNCSGLTMVNWDAVNVTGYPTSTPTSTDNHPFKNCTNLSAVVFGDQVQTIPAYAFSGCSGLTALTIPNSVTSIGSYAFSGCSGLTMVNWDAVNVTSYPTSTDNHPFKNCTNLSAVVFGDQVQTIPAYAFYGGGSIIDLTIGNSVTSIGSSAFSGCSGLTGSLTIPNSVTSIGNYAFRNCSGLTGALTIPNSVTSIGNYAFDGCSGFDGSLTIPNSVTSIGSQAFNSCSFDGLNIDMIEIPNSFISRSFTAEKLTGSLTIGNSVTSIGIYAFRNCSGLTGALTIPNSVTSIEYYAFSGCSGLTALTIPNSVTSIRDYTFSGCSGLTALTIPNSVTSIGNGAFHGCSGLTALTIPNSVTSIGNYAFKNCSGLTMVNWDAVNVTSYPTSTDNHPFKNCTNLSAVVFGDQVQTIPAYAFYGGGSIIDLTIGNSVTSIGNYAFRNCSGLTGALTIPNSVTSIGNYAFRNCSGLTGALTIPNSVTSIGNYAFDGCSGLTGSLTIPNSVTSIGNYAFRNCSGLTGALTIPNSVTSIEYYAFSGCSGLTALTIPNSVTSIGSDAFYGCSGLTALTIPNSVTSIGIYAFGNCSGLESVNYTGDIAQWCNIEFASSSSNPLYYAHNLYINDELVTNLEIPESVTEIKNYAFYGCSGLTGSLTIPNSVTSIGNYAFRNCSGLTGTLTIPNSVTTIGSNAFSNCTGITAIRMHCPVPPTINQYTFSNFDKSIPVFVACGTQEAYLVADYWSEFTAINESPYDLVITQNDPYGGEISVVHYADCEDGQCVIYAESNLGYSFAGWYVDDELLTGLAQYDFSMVNDITMEARFSRNANHSIANGATNTWSDPNTWDSGVVPSSTSTVAIYKNIIVDVEAEVEQMGIYDDGSITISQDVTLTVTDTLGSDNVASIVIEDGGQLIHSNDGAMATVKKTIQPYTNDNDGWNLLAYPLTGNGTVASIGNMLNNEYDLYAYDEPTQYWINQKEESNGFTALEAGKGYLYANIGQAQNYTTDYFPFYTYYKYSISENLFRAVELMEAGLGTGSLNGLSWYAINAPGYEQSNISIWMANVSDEELTANSHLTSGMTLVYTGNMTPAIGWNEFVFNENTFAWDGTSNLLISVQRNNGAYNSSVLWQSHEASFTAMSYNYTDNVAYDATTATYSMCTSTSRPNIIFNGITDIRIGDVQYNPITLTFSGELENGTAEVIVPLSYTETAGTLKGFNLVGNPYVHNVTSYGSTNVADGCFRLNDTKDNLIVSEVSETLPLKPAEGFFVKATAEGASITFNPGRSRSENERKGFVNLELRENGKLIDRLIVKREGEPLEKLSLKGNSTRLYAMQNKQEVAIVSCDDNEQPVNFKATKNGSYMITASLDNMAVDFLHLIDNLTGADVDLLALRQAQGPMSYTFEAKTTDYDSRFKLVFSFSGDENGDDAPFAFINNGNIIIVGAEADATLQIVDVLGHVIHSGDAMNRVSTSGMSPGVYVLRLINGEEVKTQKIVIE